MTWTYEQATGKLRNPDGGTIAVGYAGGNCGANPEGKNNPAMEAVKCVGPLPKGKYLFGNPHDDAHLGPFAIPLIPDPANEMFGRAGFYMHGDKVSAPGNASEGCIIMPRHIRELCAGSDDNELEVV
jgi:hypothetical protein